MRTHLILGLSLLLLLSGCINNEKVINEVQSAEIAMPQVITDLPTDVKVEGPSRFDPAALSAAWDNPEISGETISILEGMVEKYRIVNFNQEIDGKRIPLMAVKTTDGKINVMPRICVPCRSEGWHLKGDVLICDTCGTTFDARTGAGISGACKDYSKALVQYTREDGKLIMRLLDIADAYAKTLNPGWP